MKKYYEEIKNKIDSSLKEKNFDFAFKLIEEELSMPYIPLEFEKYLNGVLSKIPIPKEFNNSSFTIEKIVDLLIKLDNDENDYSKLISQLNKFNLKNNLEEVEYFFSKAKNKRNIALFFDELCKQKVNINLPLGNPLEVKPITEVKEYIDDVKKVELLLSKYPLLIEPGIDLLKEMYLTKHMGQKMEGNFHDIVVYTLSKIFHQEELIKESNIDIKNVQKKLEMFSSITKL